MTLSVSIRSAVLADADALSALIINVLHVSNMADYGPDNIARVVGHFSPDGVRVMLENRETLVAEMDGVIVGTAAIGPASTHDGQSVRTFFVKPDLQGHGVGTALFEALMKQVSADDVVTVRSSIAGEQFYAARGFVKVKDHWDGDERTIEMRLNRS